ncbi:pyruvate ferredoxin oxidoreductase, partial [Patescibacteria group bacterium]|nr:pyruvate ferredoxin oxidoreductase [Patescibacteria group bacterium]
MKQILEGSRAIALTIKNIKPAVISAYPITPQTHIVEDLAKFKADGEADYEYVRAESEFAAASIIEGASAAGVRVYTATSSQGLLLMAEVVFNIAGMRLPIVMTCANRGVSAPITIWNDHQDAMTVRDAGWVMLFAENHQEAVDQHIMAYKIAEQTNLPVIVNVDGFVLTHTYDSVVVPDAGQIKKYLPDYKPKKGQYLDTNNPVTMGAFAAPAYYMEIRQELHDDLVASLDLINEEYKKYHEIITKTRKHENKAKEILATAIQKCGLSQAQEITTTTVALPSEEIKGRIIGKEGRNIRTLEKLTGVEVIVDETPEAVVNFSKVLIFLPSLPIILPLISSEGKATVVV